jgi:ribosomal protein S18 acetylase RimI-like enzyme
LEATDEAHVRQWLAAYLAEHQRWWAQGYGTEATADLSELVERDWQELQQASHSEKHLALVLELDGRTVGIIQAGQRADRFQGFQIGVLQWIYVAPERRGQGLADELMRHALTWMDAQGVSGKEVFVTALNPAAVALYRRHGFEVADYRMLARGPATS